MYKNLLYLLIACAMLGAFHSCYTEDVVDNYFTFTGELIGDYVENQPELFSEFERVLDTTGVMGLMKAYGLYTCFLPTNEAMHKYYEDHHRQQLSDFTMTEIKMLCYNHILKGDTIATIDFSSGALGTMNMNGRYVSVSYSDTTSTIYMNGSAPIIEKDVFLHNGIVHVLGQTMELSEDKVSSVLMNDTLFSLFAQAFDLTGYRSLIDNSLVEDESYDPANYTLNNISHAYSSYEQLPQYRKYGYTIFVESNATLAEYGVTDMESFYKYAESLYDWGRFAGAEEVEDDYADSRNYLNRYIAYHIIDRTLLSSRLIKDYDTPHMLKNYDMYEYIPTLLDNTLIEVKLDRDYIRGTESLGMINCKSMVGSDGFDTEDPTTAILLGENIDKPNGGSLNGYYHELTKPLAYTKDFEAFLSSKRLRIDGAANLREVATNNMRGNNPTASSSPPDNHNYQIPYGYFENLEATEATQFVYLGATSLYEDYQGDELFARQPYNFSVKTIPIPAGNYEVRMGYQATGNRGIAQLYWDSVPAGIPVNFSLMASSASIGYEKPGSNDEDPYGYENDKMMRNRGYMKAPDTYRASDDTWYSSINVRNSDRCMRYILGTFDFKEAAPHYITVVYLGSESSGSQFMLDYLEFCPIELISTEDTH